MKFFVLYVFPCAQIAIGIAMLLKGRRDLRIAAASERWLSTTGIVRESQITKDVSDGWPVYGAAVLYDYQVGSNEYRGSRVSFGEYSSSRRRHAESVIARYPVGSTHPVFYDPTHPDCSVLEPGRRPETYIFFIGGVLGVIAAVVWLFAAPTYFPRFRDRFFPSHPPSSPRPTKSPNNALQRTPGFGVQLPGAALIGPAQSRAVLPALKPGTARAFASRRRAHSRVPGPESLSLGSLGAFDALP